MNGETAVVTGASRGIGEAVAHRFAEAGAHVVLCARDSEAVEAVAAAIEEAGGETTAIRADVRDEFDVERLMEQAAGINGEIGYVVANAGVYHGETGNTPFAGESYAAFDDHFRINARGVFAAIREAIPHLASDARILVPSGSIARTAKAGYGSYAASKAAAEAIARGFSTELEQPVGIVDPGLVETDLTGATGHEPTDVAEQFLWAATDAAAEAVDGEIIDRRTWRKASR